ncbi:MAG: 23S rRNA (uracil(1939)-C(5))-methyltransferase RlmD, partial [Tenericutes bacterium]|nr:23S rRNA (uracil(1939)-C(5))-methyltransferase RlmD [Mycoplasmatota bacterium]
HNAIEGDGVLRSCIIRESSRNKEIVFLLNLVTDSFEQEAEFIEKITNKSLLVKGIGVVKTDDESSFSKDKIRLIYGKDFLTEELLGNNFEIGFRSFFQINTVQTERLYKTAIEVANLSKKDKVIDAYCGIGSIALSVAKKVYRVFGIEVIESAIEDAKKNAALNNIKNAFFEVGNAETVLKKWKKYKFDCIFIDPPRKGCSKSFISTLVNMKIPKIVYISCNPATLGRDLELLLDVGYKINSVTPVDMFPQTTHVESVTLLTLE